ncbi:hypothetical protein [Luteimonas sp. A649]
MSHERELSQVLRATSTLLARIEQRDAVLRTAVDGNLQTLQDAAARLHQQLNAIVSGAQTRITDEARAALLPVAAEYGSVMSSAATQLHSASRTVWTWYAGLVGVGLLLAVVGWGVLGYYQRELTRAKDELVRYENAIPVVRAFHASDAIVCGDRICVNVDTRAGRQGDRQQYVRARSSAGL